MKKFFFLFIVLFQQVAILSAQDLGGATISIRPDQYYQDPDTLHLTSGKPYMVFYLIHHSFTPDRTYGKNTMTWCMEREWNELQQQYPDIELIFLNEYTIVNVANQKQQQYRLSNIDNGNYGIFYWNGNEVDVCDEFKSDAIELTEFIAKKRNEKKISSYVLRYNQEIAEIGRIQTLFSPSEALIKNARYIPIVEISNMNYYPINLMDLKGIKTISFSKEHEDDFLKIHLNPDNTLSKVYSYRKNQTDSVSYTYQDGLPLAAVENGNTIRFFYEEDTVYTFSKYSVNKYVMYGSLFAPEKTYSIQSHNDNYKDTKCTSYDITRQQDGKLIVRSENKTYIYSNLAHSLPYTYLEISKFKEEGKEETMTIEEHWSINRDGDLSVVYDKKLKINTKYDSNSSYFYKMENGRIVSRTDLSGKNKKLYFSYEEY